jgi:hypothetical protein
LSKVYTFTGPAPTEPAKITSAPQQARHKVVEKAMAEAKALREDLIKGRQHELIKEPQPKYEDDPIVVPPPTRQPAKPAPTPGLSNAEVNRAFNDFQAFILEALADFRNEILKARK